MRSRKLKNFSRLASLSAAAVAGLAWNHTAGAAAFNILDNNNAWTASGRWSLQSGTDGDSVPDSDDTITFVSDATISNQPTVGNGDRSVQGLTIINANGTSGTYLLGATGGSRTLNIGSSGLTASTTTGSSTSTFATIMGLTANQQWNIGANTTIQLNNTVGMSGAFQLTKDGAGTLNVNGMTASIGSLVYNAGSITNPGAAGISLSSTSTALTLSDVTTSMKFSLTGASGGSVVYSGSGAGATIGAVDLGNVVRTFDIAASAASVETDINGIISGVSGGVTKSTGTGALQFSGSTNNTYGGLTTVSAGTLNLNKTANATAIAGNLTINTGGTVAYTSASTSMIANSSVVTVSGGSLNMGSVANDTVATFNMGSGSLDGSGTLVATTYGLTGGTVNGNLGAGTANVSGTVTLNGTLAANVNISSGSLALGANDRIANGATVSLTGTGALNTGTATDTVSTLSFNGGSLNGSGTLTSTNTVTIQGSGNTIAANLIGDVNFSGAASLALNGSITGAVSANNGTLSGSGTINGSTSFLGNGSVSGTGLTFNGPVSFVGNGHNLTGTITANSGLNVSNTGTVSVGGTVTGAATVNGKLKGTGTIGAVTVNNGGTIAPGNSPGTLNTGNETWNVGGNYQWEINDATLALQGQNPGYDFLNVTGTINLTSIAGGAGNQFTITADSMGASVANFNPNSTYTWTIATASAGITGFATNKFNIVNSMVGATGSFSVSINDTAGADNLLLTYSGLSNSISLTNSTAGNLADTNDGSGNPDSGSDPALVAIIGSGTNYVSEVDGLTSNSASGLVVTSQALAAPIYVMLWLSDTNTLNASTITDLVNSLEGESTYDIALASVGSGDALYNDIQALQPYYSSVAGSNFAALVKFTAPLAGSNVQWDFGINSDIVVDQIAIIPEPAGLGIAGATLLGVVSHRRRRRH